MKITGLIIAGGKSSRMGFDKTQILYNEKTFLENTIDLLLKFTDDILIVSNKNTNIRYPFVQDEIKGIGPIGGIYTGLKNIKTELALIVPADLPFLSFESINFLINGYDDKNLACVFNNKGKLEAMVGIYHKKILPIIEELIEKKQYKLQILLQKSVAQQIDGSNFSRDFININTTDDLKFL